MKAHLIDTHLLVLTSSDEIVSYTVGDLEGREERAGY